MAEFVSPIATDAGAGFARARLDDASGIRLTRTWDDPGVETGRARRSGAGLAFSVSPGEWILVDVRPAGPEDVDLTHVRGAIRVTGASAADLLSHVCAIDLSDTMTPTGAAARTLIAGVATELVRDDVDGEMSYLLLMSRSFAQHVWEALVAVGSSA